MKKYDIIKIHRLSKILPKQFEIILNFNYIYILIIIFYINFQYLILNIE